MEVARGKGGGGRGGRGRERQEREEKEGGNIFQVLRNWKEKYM